MYFYVFEPTSKDELTLNSYLLRGCLRYLKEERSKIEREISDMNQRLLQQEEDMDRHKIKMENERLGQQKVVEEALQQLSHQRDELEERSRLQEHHLEERVKIIMIKIILIKIILILKIIL
jgi:hypothetical protein